jgi:TonB-linked SusC/RagA family outer membrane protein
MKTKTWLLIFLLYALPTLVYAQQSVINSVLEGNITDSKTQGPLEGVTVNIKGTTNQTFTDSKGNFVLKTGQKFPYILTIRLLGYKPLDIEATGSPVHISLDAVDIGLSEVVVVGYGTQKKKDLTGAVTSISKAQFSETPKVSLDNGIKGLASGVQVTSTSNEPGGVASIRIRGSNSINTGSEPLYVIDGFPVYNNNASSSGTATVGTNVNALSLINPEDIEAIQILKDASATAIYGARGANGVVIVTTKKGKSGQARISLDSYIGVQKVRKALPLLNAAQYAQLVNDANGTSIYSDEQIASFGKGTDWQKEIFRDALVQSHQLSISGGTPKSKYYASLNYYNQDGIVINSDFKRYSARFNFESNVTEKLTFGWNLTVANTGANQAYSSSGGGEGTQGVVVSALDFSPILKVYNADGTYVMQSDRGIPIGNPVATAKELTNYSSSFRTLGNLFVNYKITEDLSFRTSLGGDLLNNKEKYYAPRTTLTGYNVQGLAKISAVNSFSWLSENTLTYDKKFNRHAFNAVAGFTTQKYNRELVAASASGFVNDILKADNLAAGALINAPASTYNSWSLASFLGRINYSFDDKYLITLTARQDGSSKFGSNNKYGFFPSAAVAWRLSEEKFIQHLKIFDDLKLRASYGVTGNQEIASYQSLATLTNTSYIIGDQVVKGFAPSNIPNPNLKWESTAQSDIGLDAAFLKGRLNVTVDAYYKKTKDMLLFVTVPYSTGFSTALQNIGSLSNKGLELTVNAAILKPKSPFQWNVNFNISTNQNKILSLGPVNQILTGEINGYLKISNPIIIEPGHPLNSFYGYISDGIFQTKDNIASSPQPNAAPGDRKYKDLDGNGVLNAADRTYIGNANPKYFGGFSNEFSYKGFELSAIFNFVQGNSILNSTRADLDLPTGQKNSSLRVLDRWTPNNPSNSIPRASLNRAFLFSDAQIEDGSYLRLGTLTLGYNLPSAALRSIHLSKLRVYVSAFNLLTLTHYTGYDPEVNQFGQDNILRGIDSDAYPSAKRFSFGVNASF